jgi:hypothetical protein
LEITETKLTEVLQSLKNKEYAPVDDICHYLLQKCVPSMLKPCLESTNASTRGGNFTSTLQKSVVKPIHKKFTNEDTSRNCPIALVPDLSKILEK